MSRQSSRPIGRIGQRRTVLTDEVNRHYDEKMSTTRRLDEQSHFTNYGYWRQDTCSRKDASETLVEELLALMPEKHGTVL
jgi:hypothetical protein